MITIAELKEDRWQHYRDLRLEALRNDPIAFGSSYEEERELTQDIWERRIKNALFALSSDKPVGMIVCVIENKPKTKHIANIYGVYVKKEFRDQGIGRRLVESVLTKIQSNKSVVKIKLAVNPEQKTAVRLYEKMGFTTAGRLKKELRVNRKFYDELIMEKLL